MIALLMKFIPLELPAQIIDSTTGFGFPAVA